MGVDRGLVLASSRKLSRACQDPPSRMWGYLSYIYSVNRKKISPYPVTNAYWPFGFPFLQVYILCPLPFLLSSRSFCISKIRGCKLWPLGQIWPATCFYEACKLRIVFTYLFSYLFIWPRRVSCGTLVPWPDIEPGPPAVKVQSPNHWTTREFRKV